jgi:hypothetical protein
VTLASMAVGTVARPQPVLLKLRTRLMSLRKRPRSFLTALELLRVYIDPTRL